MKKIRAFIDKQGFFILLAVCVLIILGSAVFAYTSRSQETEGMQADASGEYNQSLEDASRVRMLKPVQGAVIRVYDRAAWLETLGYWGAHEGVDLAAERGEAVKAALDGTVSRTYRDLKWGGVVEIDHGDGVTTRYCALKWPAEVAQGDAVLAGQTIGKVGSAAMECEDEPHVHLEMTIDGQIVNPMQYTVE